MTDLRQSILLAVDSWLSDAAHRLANRRIEAATLTITITNPVQENDHEISVAFSIDETTKTRRGLAEIKVTIDPENRLGKAPVSFRGGVGPGGNGSGGTGG